MLAFLTINPAQVVQLVVNCLAVAGGFLAGYLLTGFVAWLVDRWLTGGKSPVQLHTAAKIIGGIGIAVLIALFVFGSGTGGTGEGTGGSPATDTTGTGSGSPTLATTPEPPAPIRPPTENSAPPEQRIRVTLLGGEDVRDEKFYQIDDEAQPRTLADVLAAITTKREKTQKPVGIEIRFATRNAPAQDHAAVVRLTRWAQANRVTVSFPADKN